jgi:subtilisin family serine protease
MAENELESLRDRVQRMIVLGTIVVAPAGNIAADVAQVPARIPRVLGVTAVEAGTRLAPFASRGVELAAPGVDVLSVEGVRGDDLILSHRSGTSLAAGVVVGVTALVMGARPALTAADIRDTLTSSGVSAEQHPEIRVVDVDALILALPETL